MSSRVLTKDTFLAVAVWSGIVGGAWYAWHAHRESAVESLKQHVPPELSLGKTLAYCSLGGLAAIDVRAVFVGSLNPSKVLRGATPPTNESGWQRGAIPESDLYNESTTFICPNLPAGVQTKLLAAIGDTRNWRRYDEYSVFYLTATQIVVVHRYND
jgi:hypothetical protein